MSENPPEQFNTLEEAIEKSKELTDELGKLLDLMLVARLGKAEKQPTKKEWDELFRRVEEIEEQRNAVYQEMNRLSNGAINISKHGTRLNIRKPKGRKA